jgi:hypothetical protein
MVAAEPCGDAAPTDENGSAEPSLDEGLPDTYTIT